MFPLTATADAAVPGALDRYDAICRSIAVFGAEPRPEAGGCAFDFPFGSAFVRAEETRLELRADAADLDALARLKEIMASSVGFHSQGAGVTVTWRGDASGSQTLRQHRRMTVVSVTDITPRMRRIRLAGPDLGRFAALGGLHVRLLLSGPDGPEPDPPSEGPDGLPFWPEGAIRPIGRVYTIRRLDVTAGWMDIDVVAHTGGVGGRWALAANPGDSIGVVGPLGRPVREADWYVLGADETGLPALARILEGLPPGVRGDAFLEVRDLAERQELTTRADIRVHWLTPQGGMGDALADAVITQAWPPGGLAYGWVAAEAHAIERIRTVWRGPGGPAKDRTLAAVYWRQGDEAETQ